MLPAITTETDRIAWIAEAEARAHVPSPADVAEMDLAHALDNVAVRRLLVRAREAVDSGRLYGVAHALLAFTAFPNVSDPDDKPATPRSEPAPW